MSVLTACEVNDCVGRNVTPGAHHAPPDRSRSGYGNGRPKASGCPKGWSLTSRRYGFSLPQKLSGMLGKIPTQARVAARESGRKRVWMRAARPWLSQRSSRLRRPLLGVAVGGLVSYRVSVALDNRAREARAAIRRKANYNATPNVRLWRSRASYRTRLSFLAFELRRRLGVRRDSCCGRT
jgi:hypothetical protein